VIAMLGKKAGTKFTIIMRDNDPRHLQAAEILNNLGYHGKAQYVVDAILQFANYNENTIIKENHHTSRLDEKAVETIVNRLLREKDSITTRTPTTDEDQDEFSVMSTDEIDLENALDALSGDGFNAIADALEMFRSM